MEIVVSSLLYGLEQFILIPMDIPRVTISFAQSVDGCIATASGESRHISCEKTLKMVQKLRRDNDCILIGIGTVLRDNPQLTCRIDPERTPVRVILDSKLSIPLKCTIANTAKGVKTILFISDDTNKKKLEQLQKMGLETVTLSAEDDGKLPIPEVMESLAKRGYQSVLVEGGSRVITSFIKVRMMSKIVVTIAPILVGNGIRAFGDINVHSLKDALKPAKTRCRRMGSDFVWEFLFNKSEV
jgi:riboflavin-specific deaminase-like protein